ncbi:NAD-dependent epimerase/dehydratase family protein [Lichenicola cladoniae]|uniref:NAD-dependent epimerase/dehydratase family protein n=1 Tax=Lichenicola cladoniae TaxID=1484109 RepID=A0A6M8HTH4_9PROT|nr:NAD-dependent epimerase/dehydratase family protein [Lichenicola cladoniae]NPD65466.1 NAD-dependent epimerase/dehydratase family protein [Acetobacteraceae bacterium]QKE91467.1 NAD-dependent epimerase/dehydratase family protein [Lichenicola cladoniae]
MSDLLRAGRAKEIPPTARVKEVRRTGRVEKVLRGGGGALGLVEWFHPGEHARVEESLGRLRVLGITRLRTHISWAEYVNDGGADWYGWLVPRLAGEIELLPCVHFTPPSLSRTGRTSGPPHDLRAYADFIDHLITRFDGMFPAVEIWNEPNNLLDWDWQQDHDWLLFCEMAGAAAHWIQARGLKAVLGGPCPADLNWLRLMGERGLLNVLDAVGLHGFPGTWDAEARSWRGWPALIASVRETVDGFNPKLELWITETGYSTWRNDPFAQVTRFVEIAELPVERIYWYGLQDIAADVAVQEGLHFDERHYHFGLYTEAGSPKLLGRLLASGGLALARDIADAGAPKPALGKPGLIGTKPALVTGGAGFIGTNLADRLARDGEDVLILDSLARPGVEENLDWLRRRHRGRLSVAIADLRDTKAVADAARDASSVFHLAGQVAVTTSLVDPLADFDINLRGTINLLEALRRRSEGAGSEPVPLVFASTNKVYGDLADIRLSHNDDAYLPIDPLLRAHGIGEARPLSFHTPYGCSKGAADQYVLDYARSFGLPMVVLRMSCIYGPRQLGTEDQGWLAHFLLSALQDRPLSLYGDGRQVRDVLEVEDAVSAYLAARDHAPLVAGEAFNLGGGADNAITLLMLIEEIERLTGQRVRRDFHPWRTGDQRYFVADTRRARQVLGLSQPLGWRDGVARLLRWIETERPHLVGRSMATGQMIEGAA